MRQLKNVVRRICAFAVRDEIDEETVQQELEHEDSGPRNTRTPVDRETAATLPVDLPDLIQDLERRWFATAMHQAGGNRSAAARLLGMQPATFRKALRERYPDLAGTAD